MWSGILIEFQTQTWILSLIPYIWKFLLWFLFRELRKSQKLDTQNFRYSKFLVPYKFIQLIQLHVSIAAGRWMIFVMSFWLSFESTLRSSKYRFYSIVPGCPTPRCPILVGLCLEQCHCQQSQQLIKKSGSLLLKARSMVTTTGIQLTQENRTALLAAISNVFTFALLIVDYTVIYNILLICEYL